VVLAEVSSGCVEVELTVSTGPEGGTIGPGGEPVAGCLAAYWKLDETSGTMAADSSGSNCNGTLSGGPVWQPSGGKLGGACNSTASTTTSTAQSNGPEHPGQDHPDLLDQSAVVHPQLADDSGQGGQFVQAVQVQRRQFHLLWPGRHLGGWV